MQSDEHIPQHALEKYAMEMLPESEIELVENHLLACEACRGRLGHLNQFMADLLKVVRETTQEVALEDG